MALDIKIKTNTKALSKNIGKLQSRLTRAIDKGAKQAGFQLLDIIRTKTAKGVDARDVPFAQYSKSYIKQLEREGKPLKVDLFYSGRMLGSLSSKKTGRFKSTLNFSNAQMTQRALFNQVLNEPKREFFGFNDKTENIISKQFNRFIKRELEKIRL